MLWQYDVACYERTSSFTLLWQARERLHCLVTTSFASLLFAEFGGFGSVTGKIDLTIRINHEGEVNR